GNLTCARGLLRLLRLLSRAGVLLGAVLALGLLSLPPDLTNRLLLFRKVRSVVLEHGLTPTGGATRAALLQRDRGGRSGRGRIVDDPELLAHRPQVRGGPVQEHTDRERDSRDGEDQRQDVHEQLLLPSHRVVERRGGHVLLRQVLLLEEHRGAHEHHEHRGDDLDLDVVGTEEGRGERGAEDLRGFRLQGGQLVERTDRIRVALGDRLERVEYPEQREEDRHLRDERQARGERRRAVVLVDGHHLLLHGLPGCRVGLALVLLLQLL